MTECKHEWAPVKESISGVEYDCAICRARKLVSHTFFTEDRIREIVREEIRAAFECEGCDDRVFLYCRQCKTGHKP